MSKKCNQKITVTLTFSGNEEKIKSMTTMHGFLSMAMIKKISYAIKPVADELGVKIERIS